MKPYLHGTFQHYAAKFNSLVSGDFNFVVIVCAFRAAFHSLSNMPRRKTPPGSRRSRPQESATETVVILIALWQLTANLLEYED